MNAPRRLYRSSSNRVFGGVAAGFAQFFGLDVGLIRLLFAASFIFGFGVLLYPICWMIIPNDAESDLDEAPRRPSFFLTIVKLLAVVACVAVIAEQFDGHAAVVTFAIGLGIGVFFLFRNRRSGDDEDRPIRITRLHRSASDRKIFGVVGGIAEMTGIDSTLLRVLAAIGLVAAAPFIIPVYLIYALLVPERRLITI